MSAMTELMSVSKFNQQLKISPYLNDYVAQQDIQDHHEVIVHRLDKIGDSEVLCALRKLFFFRAAISKEDAGCGFPYLDYYRAPKDIQFLLQVIEDVSNSIGHIELHCALRKWTVFRNILGG